MRNGLNKIAEEDYKISLFTRGSIFIRAAGCSLMMRKIAHVKKLLFYFFSFGFFPTAYRRGSRKTNDRRNLMRRNILCLHISVKILNERRNIICRRNNVLRKIFSSFPNDVRHLFGYLVNTLKFAPFVSSLTSSASYFSSSLPFSSKQ